MTRRYGGTSPTPCCPSLAEEQVDEARRLALAVRALALFAVADQQVELAVLVPVGDGEAQPPAGERLPRLHALAHVGVLGIRVGVVTGHDRHPAVEPPVLAAAEERDVA